MKNVLIIVLTVLIIYLFQEHSKTELKILKLEEAIIELHFKIGDISRAEFRKAFWSETITNYIVKTNYAKSGQTPKTITITNYKEAEE